jgi:hypothetical protein
MPIHVLLRGSETVDIGCNWWDFIERKPHRLEKDASLLLSAEGVSLRARKCLLPEKRHCSEKIAKTFANLPFKTEKDALCGPVSRRAGIYLPHPSFLATLPLVF